MDERKTALAQHIKISVADIDSPTHKTSRLFKHDNRWFWVLTNDEADKYVDWKITESLYLRKTEDLLHYVKDCPFGIMADVQSFGSEANPILKRILGAEYSNFYNHILAGVDNNRSVILGTVDQTEHKSNDFFIYRIR